METESSLRLLTLGGDLAKTVFGNSIKFNGIKYGFIVKAISHLGCREILLE
ncbi:Uncharacterised protein [Serratia quinivorans]|uniref:hypothetical protein n=1 Tax=Serratia quinivorans TaxID=137545 RepID=UPI00217BA18C|nr:hypothetical protein [Serratia quinivorans]CAI1645078.1 Uncharacterised protein [Serratia quinivorans]